MEGEKWRHGHAGGERAESVEEISNVGSTKRQLRIRKRSKRCAFFIPREVEISYGYSPFLAL